MKHMLFSHEQDGVIEWFGKFDPTAIKTAIIKHLQNNPTDTLEHTKEYSKADAKRFYGYQIVNLYAVNPKNGKPSKCITSGNKTTYKPLTP